MVEARELYIAAADLTAYLRSQEGYAVDPRPVPKDTRLWAVVRKQR